MNRTGASAVMTDYASDTVGRHAKGLKGEERGMIKIFIGAILALLDFTVTNGSMRFRILPDFIGCFYFILVLMISGCLSEDMPTTGDSKDNAACIDRLFGNSLCDGIDRDRCGYCLA